MEGTAVILAAGAGRRLGELGRRHSKAMLPVAGRPLIEWTIERLRSARAAKIVVVGHAGDSELAIFLREQHPTIRLVTQAERLGIADALVQALPLVADREAFLACACDSVFRVDDIARLIARGEAARDAAVIGVLDMGIDATRTRSAVALEGERVVRIEEKPTASHPSSGLVGMPLYWLPRTAIPHIRHAPLHGGERYVSTALNAFIKAGGLVLAVQVGERIEVTTADDIAPAEQLLREQR